MATAHNEAEKGEIARIVLMPGDPLRARHIAQTYLDQPVQFNAVRGMLGYTGEYRGRKVSVMGSGMGMPSIGIYSYELFRFYDVDAIIRVGSAGAYVSELNLFDLVLADSAWSESTYALAQSGESQDVQQPDPQLNEIIRSAAHKLQVPLHEGRIHSSDVFYHEQDELARYRSHGCVCVEMESFALFHNARVCGKQAACLLTISDSLISGVQTSAAQRERAFGQMMETALESAWMWQEGA
ncbi:MAG TPA: purine-nucleoside phosphorylase [Candidatus Merdibacter merdipullorum]|nr:purine-nucleoside phosphorylase [Candidatus Merdibacter merdipullorum]